MDNSPKAKYKRILEHAIGVIVAAAVAGLFTFIQQIIGGSGLCPNPGAQVEQAGFIGALLKGGHSAFKAKSGTMFL